jgi:MFS family permease
MSSSLFLCCTRRRAMLLVTSFVSFISESSRGLFLSNLFSYMIYLTGNATDALTLSGYSVAAFSLGKLVAAYVTAAMVDHGGVSYRTVLLYCFLVQIFSLILYLLPYQFSLYGGFGGFVIVFSRFLLGFGSGTTSTTRSIVVDLTDANERTRELSYLSFARYIGYAITPGLAAFSTMQWDIAGIEVNAYTLPAWAAIFFNLVSFFLVFVTIDGMLGWKNVLPDAEKSRLYIIRACKVGYIAMKGLMSEWRDTFVSFLSPCFPKLRKEPTEFEKSDIGKMCKYALYQILFLNFVTKGASAIIESTIAAQYAAAHDAAGDDPNGNHVIVVETSDFMFEIGAIGIVGMLYMMFKPKQSKDKQFFLAKYANEIDVWITIGTLFMSAIGDFISIPPLSTSTLYLGTVLAWSIPSPILEVLSVSLLSVLLSNNLKEKSSQATYMGYVSAIGALGRVMFPFLIPVVSIGGSLIFAAFSTLVSLVVLVWFYVSYPKALDRQPNSFSNWECRKIPTTSSLDDTTKIEKINVKTKNMLNLPSSRLLPDEESHVVDDSTLSAPAETEKEQTEKEPPVIVEHFRETQSKRYVYK